MRGPRKLSSTLQQKIDWMIENKKDWEDLPDNHLLAYRDGDYNRRILKIKHRLISEGLYSESTNTCDINVLILIRKTKEYMRRNNANANTTSTATKADLPTI